MSLASKRKATEGPRTRNHCILPKRMIFRCTSISCADTNWRLTISHVWQFPPPILYSIQWECIRAPTFIHHQSFSSEWIRNLILLRWAPPPKKKKKTGFFCGDFSQMWVGGVADSHPRSKTLKKKPNHPENRLFRPKVHLSFSQITQKPWGGWVLKQIWERSPKNFFVCFFWGGGGLP